MQDRSRIEFLTVAIDLSVVGLRTATELHVNRVGCPPTTVVCGWDDAQIAYALLRDHPQIPRLAVIAVPGFLRGAWMVCSSSFAVISGEA